MVHFTIINLDINSKVNINEGSSISEWLWGFEVGEKIRITSSICYKLKKDVEKEQINELLPA